MFRSRNLTATAVFFLLCALMPFALTGCAGMSKDMGYAEYKSSDEWVEKTKTGPVLPLAKEADVWSEMKNFSTPTGVFGVQSKFLRQNATTCTFEVKFTNNGTKSIGANVSLQSMGKEKVYSHRFTTVNVDPGKAVWYEMEKRECPLKWGESKDMTLCAQCSPVLVFLK